MIALKCSGVALLAGVTFVLAGCGGSSSFSKAQAEAGARQTAALVVRQQQRACHERVRVTKIVCEPKGSAWSCRFSLSDGSGGLVLEPHPTGQTHPEITTIC
jgi:hypothetical protein